MNKKIFQALFMISAMVVGTAGFVGCSEDYDDDINRLETLINENENAISAINQLVASGSVITGVATNTEGLEITLSNGQKYTITDGVDGTDAVLWTVGEDGYWYKDGVKQDFKAIGEDGVDGQDGADGVNGADGAPGGYYKPNIDGTWDLYSADGTLLDADTGLDWKVPLGGNEEPLTAVWNPDGSLVLSGEATNNETLVIGQSVLSDLVFIPQYTMDGHNAQEVKYIPFRYHQEAPCWGMPAMHSAEEVHYRINPTSIDKDEVEWDFIGRTLITRATGDMDYFEPITTCEDYGVGALTFLLQFGEEDSEFVDLSQYLIPEGLSGGQEAVTFALKGVQAVQLGAQDSQTVISDYAVAVPSIFEPVIARTDMEVDEPLGANPNKLLLSNIYDVLPDISAPHTYEIHPGVPFDLTKHIFACAEADASARPLIMQDADLNFVENYGFVTGDYRLEFTKVTDYLGYDDETDQSYFIDIDPVTGILTVNTTASSLARRPVVKVTWYANKDYGCPSEDRIVKVAYIKFVITPVPVSIVPFELGQIPYSDLFVDWLVPSQWVNVHPNYPLSSRSYKWMCIDWTTVNDDVYEPLGVSHDEFMGTYYRDISPWPYDLVNYQVVSHKMMDGAGAYTIDANDPIIFAWVSQNWFTAPNVDTYAMCLGVTPFAKFGKYEVKVQVDPGDHHPVVTFTFHYEILRPDLVVPMVPGFLLDPSADPKTIVTQGTDYGFPGNYRMQAYAGEAFNRGKSINGATSYRSFFGEDTNGAPTWVPGLINETDHRIMLRSSTTEDKRLTMYDFGGGFAHYRYANTGPVGDRNINHIFGWNDQQGIRYMISPAYKLWEDDRTYLLKLTTYYPNGEINVHNYNLMFVNPLAMTVADILFTDYASANKDIQNLRTNVSVDINSQELINAGVNNGARFFDYGLNPNQTVMFEYLSTNTPYEPFFNRLPPYMTPYVGLYNGVFEWENDGTKLTSTEKIGEMTVTCDTPFAKRVVTKDVHVQPGQ